MARVPIRDVIAQGLVAKIVLWALENTFFVFVNTDFSGYVINKYYTNTSTSQ